MCRGYPHSGINNKKGALHMKKLSAIQRWSLRQVGPGYLLNLRKDSSLPFKTSFLLQGALQRSQSASKVPISASGENEISID